MKFNVPAFDDTYEIICQLSAGGGGIIYKAYHKRLNKYVVVKRIKNSVKDKIDVRGEADILKNLHHTYLPQVYDFISIGDEYFTVIDFVEGVSFDVLLRQGHRFPQERIIKWCRQLCEAVSYLHSQRPCIIHSDIKPANVMLTPNDDICLIDFNISLVVNGDVSAIGKSDGYSPPEQYIGFNRNMFSSTASSGFSANYYGNIGTTIDERSDIYSIGATLYHMLTLQRPAPATQAVVPLESFDLDITDGLKYIVSTAMQPDPAMRFQTVGQMLKAVYNIAKLDREYKKKTVHQIVSVIAVSVMVALFAVLTMIGKNTMDKEKYVKYESYISDARECIDNFRYDEAIENAINAQSIFENEAEPYYLNAYAIYRSGDYKQCASYLIEKTRLDLTGEPSMIAGLYHLLANSYYELGMFDESEEYFIKAIDEYDENGSYYRDYAIMLADTGRIDESFDMLGEARDKGIDEASVLLVEGEILFVKGENTSAVAKFIEAAEKSDDKELKIRAYISAAEIYDEELYDCFAAIELLEKALDDPGLSGDLILTEKLGEEYTVAAMQTEEDKYYLAAIDCFEKIINNGYERYYLMYNISVLYRAMGDFESAEKQLFKIDEKFPDRYETYMNLSLTEFDIQNLRPVSERNYDKAYEYYLRANELYKASGKSDSEMHRLDGLIEEAKLNGWL